MTRTEWKDLHRSARTRRLLHGQPSFWLYKDERGVCILQKTATGHAIVGARVADIQGYAASARRLTPGSRSRTYEHACFIGKLRALRKVALARLP